ncbi:unnamed protein product [Absidia cylindrospora]
MGCCLSQPEIETQGNTSRTADDHVGSPAVPPPEYERHDYVVESGKPFEPIQGSSTTVVGATSTSMKIQQEKKETDLSSTNDTDDTDDTSGGWPIIIRSSMAGKDITMQLPGLESTPYWTIHELRQHLEPQLQEIALASSSSSSSSTANLTLRIRFIHLGKILSETTTLIPRSHHNTTTTPSDSIIMDKYGVIQAMVSRAI